MLSPKDPAPAFSLPSTSGRDVSSRQLLGRRYVLYFYPRDDTPGCTREACDFRDNIARLGAAGIPVLGVSKDSLASHEKFRAKYGLPFELLSDVGNAVARKYGAFGQKTMYGKPVTGVIRSTFLIDARGKIERVWSPVRVDGHVDAVLIALAEGKAPKGGAKAGTTEKSAGTIVPRRAASSKKSASAKQRSATRPSKTRHSGTSAKKSTTSRASTRTTPSRKA
jgi:peroxiredoxin Q/BCP